MSQDLQATRNNEIKYKIFNKLLKKYSEELENFKEIRFDEETVKTILETGDNKKQLLEEIKELTRKLLKYYHTLSSLEKSVFKGSEVYNKYN